MQTRENEPASEGPSSPPGSSGGPRDALSPGGVDDVELRARLAATIGFVMVFVFIALALAHLFSGRYVEAAANLAFGLVAGVAGRLARETKIYLVVLHVALALITLGIALIVGLDRGAGVNAGTVALAEVPLFATLLGGVRVGAVWAVVASSLSAGLAALAARGIVPGGENKLFNDHAVLITVTATLFLVAALYERDRMRSLRRVAELEAIRHRAELERLRTTSDARVAQAERLASLGRIASAVAHEINNPLSYVQNNLEFLVGRLDGPSADELNTAVQEGIDGVRRVRGIVSDLHRFTRPGEGATSGADVVVAIEAALKMATSHLRPKAVVHTDLPRTLLVRGDVDRLTQVFLNLLVNAAQAIPDGNALENTVDVRVISSDAAIVVEVEDSGEGIPPDLIHRVTDPFFSSKPTGEGLGLGLAVSHAIVESMGGKLAFESRPGKTVARVTLVRFDGERKVSGVRARSEPPPSEDGASSILIVDDEVLVARAIKRNLRGHDVTIAQGGKEALALLAGGASFDLVLCDLMMPELSGMDLYEEVKQARPELCSRFIFMTGGTFTARAKEFRESTPEVFLDKPVDTRALKEHLLRWKKQRAASQ